jgi:hypothetical protein
VLLPAALLLLGCLAVPPDESSTVAGAVVDSPLERERAAAALAKKHGAAAARQQRAASAAQWNASVVVVVTWHNRSLDWLAELGSSLDHEVALALYCKGGNTSCSDTHIPAALRRAVRYCDAGWNSEGREAHTMALFATQFYHALPRVTVFVHDNEYGGLLTPLRNKSASEVRSWVREVEAQPSPLFRDRRTCLCAEDVREPNWRTYGPRKEAMVWLMERVLGFHNASARWRNVAFPPTACLAVPARAVLSRPKLVFELIYALTNGTSGAAELGPKGERLWLPQLTFTGWENGEQRKWQPFSTSNLERLWFAVFDVDYDPDLPFPPPGPPPPPRNTTS